MHLWSSGQPWLVEEWVDVTVTHPWRQQLRRKASSANGVAAADAENRKEARYGVGRGGVRVTPFAVETWGRMGAGAETLLSKLSAHWAWRTRARAGAAAAKERQWRAELGVALVRAQAATLLEAATVRRSSGASDCLDSGSDDGGE